MVIQGVFCVFSRENSRLSSRENLRENSEENQGSQSRWYNIPVFYGSDRLYFGPKKPCGCCAGHNTAYFPSHDCWHECKLMSTGNIPVFFQRIRVNQLIKVKNPLWQLFAIEIKLVIYFELLNLTHHHDC